MAGPPPRRDRLRRRLRTALEAVRVVEAEEPLKIAFDLNGERIDRNTTPCGERGVSGGEVGGMICPRAGGSGEGREFFESGRKPHRGRVGFDEQAVGRDDGIDGFQARFARIEKGAVEGKIGAEIGEGFYHLDGAAVGVQEETAGWPRRGAQQVVEKAEGVEAMEGRGAVLCGGALELPDEDFGLLLEGSAAKAGEARVVGPGAIEHPAIETELADASRRMGLQRGEEGFLPRGGAIAGFPRMQAVAGNHAGGMRGCERGDVGPVGFTGAVDDPVTNADGGEIGKDAFTVRPKPGVVPVIVCVAEPHGLSVSRRLAMVGEAGVSTRTLGGVLGERADGVANGGEAVAAGGRKLAREAERFERIDLARKDLGGRAVVEAVAKQMDEAFDERAFGVAAEGAASLAQRADQPHGGDASAYAIRVGALGGGEGWQPSGAIDDDGEALLGIFNHGEILDQQFLFFG